MALSRTVPGLLLAFGAVPGEALPPIDYRLPPPRVEQAYEPQARCPTASDEEEIVVCGSRDEAARYRVSFDPVPGARHRLIAGEPPSAMGALGAGDGRCSTVGRDQMCGGGLDVFAIGFAVLRLIRQARANRD